MKTAFGLIAVMALALVCFMPMASYDADEAEIIYDGDDVLKVSSTATFKIMYTFSNEEDNAKITYEAKLVNKSNETMTSGVSPSSGTLTSGVEKSLTVTAPSTAGEYRLVVDYYLGDDDDKKKSAENDYKFVAVNPIVLKVNLKAEEVTLNLESFGVYFYIDGEKMEDSYTTVSLASNGTGSVSYNWIANPERGSTHTFYVKAVGETDLIKGLDEVHTFYANDNDYSLVIALAFIVLIALIAFAVYVYRKPVKNFGKPKSRR